VGIPRRARIYNPVAHPRLRDLPDEGPREAVGVQRPAAHATGRMVSAATCRPTQWATHPRDLEVRKQQLAGAAGAFGGWVVALLVLVAWLEPSGVR
jgi:hypothetical protein